VFDWTKREDFQSVKKTRSWRVEERLQKLIARAGVASRRQAEQLLLAGEVTVNGRVVTELGSKADPATDHIKVRGKLLRYPAGFVYFMHHKLGETIVADSDPEGRQTVRNKLKGVPDGVAFAGRLGYHEEGLLLLTSDGELANRLMKASRALKQTYWLKVKGPLGGEEIAAIERRTGARLKSAPSLPGAKGGPNPWYEAIVPGGAGDVLRQMLFQSGHPVEKLRRVQLAGLELGDLPPGATRPLTPQELGILKVNVARAFRPLEGREARGRVRRGKQNRGGRRREQARREGRKQPA
jgi:23S rRNA pseudouridine2605 synthase